MGLRFEWDHKKAATNIKKHVVSFDEACTVFVDPLACIFDDEDHSHDEVREIIVGYSALGRLLVVSFTERQANLVRVISARLATNSERGDYEENKGT